MTQSGINQQINKSTNRQTIPTRNPFLFHEKTVVYIYTYFTDIGDIAAAREQTRGKGRGNRVWESSLGGLYISIIKAATYYN